jgi:ATP-binding cassette subfamily B (MDR/TAP) protein 10
LIFFSNNKNIPLAKGGIEPTWEPMGGVEYEGVVFAYPNRDKTPVLTGLNLKIPSSTVTAVVGSSGSGKSTLAALLLRLYDPQGGIIKLDGTPVHMYDPVWLRSHIGTVSQVSV